MTINKIQLIEDNVPKYFQLVMQLETMINVGQLKAYEKIPSERKLAKQLGVSVITVTKAMVELMNRGLVERRIGSGTYVCDIKSRRRTARRIGFFYHHNFNAQAGFMNTILANLLDFWSQRNFDILPLTREPKDYEKTIDDYKLCGAFVYSPKKEFVSVIKKLLKKQFPVIALSSIQDGLNSISFGYSNVAIMEAVINYLADLGHKDIALMLPNINETAYCNRLEGFQKAMWKCRLSLNPVWLKPLANEEQAIRNFLENSPLPDSVILGSCGFAKTLYRVLEEMKINVPEDISVISIDEDDSFLSLNKPPSSFRIDVKSLTLESAAAMFQVVNHEAVSLSSQRNFEFVERYSCLNILNKEGAITKTRRSS